MVSESRSRPDLFGRCSGSLVGAVDDNPQLQAPNLEVPNLEVPNLEVPNLEAPNWRPPPGLEQMMQVINELDEPLPGNHRRERQANRLFDVAGNEQNRLPGLVDGDWDDDSENSTQTIVAASMVEEPEVTSPESITSADQRI